MTVSQRGARIINNPGAPRLAPAPLRVPSAGAVVPLPSFSPSPRGHRAGLTLPEVGAGRQQAASHPQRDTERNWGL